MGLKAVGLAGAELQMAIDIYNNVGAGGAWADKTNYDYIIPEGLKEAIEKKIFGKKLLNKDGMKLTEAVHKKIESFLNRTI